MQVSMGRIFERGALIPDFYGTRVYILKGHMTSHLEVRVDPKVGKLTLSSVVHPTMRQKKYIENCRDRKSV